MTTDYDIFTVGEAPFSHSADDLAEYVLPQNGELKTVFQFELMDIDSSDSLEPLIPKPWRLSDLKNVVEKWQTFKREEGFWNTSVHSLHSETKGGSPEADVDHMFPPTASLLRTTTNPESCRASGTTPKNGDRIPLNSLRC